MARQNTLVGLDRVLEQLDEMAANVQKKHTKKAAREAMKIALKEARQRAKAIDDPSTSENISKNITLQVGKTDSRNKVKIRLGVKGGGRFYEMPKKRRNASGQMNTNVHYKPIPNDTRYWWLIEFGTAKTPAVPFLRPALANNIQSITDKFGQQLYSDIVGDIR